MPFRERYLSYDELTAVCMEWAKKYPNFVKLSSIGKSVEGRELWLLTLGEEPDRDRPSVWVDGNMHATEVAGSSVALAIAERKIRMHADGETFALPAHLCEQLKETRFFVLPRMCPDGAEAILRDGRYVRSNPRDGRPRSPSPRWLAQDLDGDGRALLMRRESPHGEFVDSKKRPGFLVPRQLEDEGPFYQVFPEGIIEHFDGTIPSPTFLEDYDSDLNRNFPHMWKGEPDQIGAGRFPLSEPESRAVVEVTTKTPTIFAWLNLHTFGGVYIRPPGTIPDKKFHPQDLALYKQIGELCEKHGGYPMVSSFEEFLYEPDKPLYGDLTDYAFHERGAVAYVCELWDLFNELGIARKRPFVDHYNQLSRDDWENLADWDARKNGGRVVQPWVKVTHPQLGAVEVGGLDTRIGVSNPPLDRISEVCDRQCDAFFRTAAMGPRVTTRELDRTRDGDVTTLRIHVENLGYLPTYVVASGKALAHNGPIYAQATCEGCSLVDLKEAAQNLGHLEGYGRGLHAHAVFYLRGQGGVSERTFTVRVRGTGTVSLRIGSLRVGFVERRIAV